MIPRSLSLLCVRAAALSVLLFAGACGGSSESPSSTASPVLGPGQIDLSVSVAVDQPEPIEQTLVQFTVTVENSAAGANATGVRLQAALPPGLAFASAAPTQGIYARATADWFVGDLASGGSAQLVLRANVDPGTGGQTLALDASVTGSDQVDPDPAQDASSAAVTVDADADLSLALAFDDPSPVRNQPLELLVTLANAAGGARATGIAVDVTLPAGLVLDGHDATAGGFDTATRRWTLAALDSGATAELRLLVSVFGTSGGTVLGATATITAVDQPDPDGSADAGAAQVGVFSETVELVRDAFGVPHVFAQSDQGAYFGAGVASAQDRLAQMLLLRMQFRGRVAQSFGRGPKDRFVDSDRKARLYGFGRRATKALAALDPETRSLLRSFADGVNEVLGDPATVIHPIVSANGVSTAAWTAEDCLATWDWMGTFFGANSLVEAKQLHDFEAVLATTGGDVDAAVAQFVTPAVLDDSAAVVQQSEVPPALQQAMADYASDFMPATAGVFFDGDYTAPKFSHSWAVAGTNTTDGRAVLVSDPRLPLERPSTLIELHVVGETFDVRGTTFPGCLNLIVGQSANVAWGGSALGVDQEDLFRIQVDTSTNPDLYEWEGAMRPMEFERNETIGIKGELSIVETYRETLLGPIVTPLVTDVQPGEEYAVRRASDSDLEPDSAAGFLAMYRATGLDAFDSALEGFRYPSTNLVFADAAGRVGYRVNGAVPVRSSAQPYAVLSGRLAQEGRGAADDWVEFVPHGLLPALRDPVSGFVFTANHMPVGSWYPIRLNAGTGANGDTARSRRLRELFADMSFPVDADAVLAPHFDMVNAAERDLVRLAVHARDDLGFTFSGSAEAAIMEAQAWLAESAAAGEEGDKSAVHRAVALVSNLKLVLRLAQSAEMVETYGSGLSGTMMFLKERLAERDATGMANLQTFELSWLDTRLAEAWAATVAEYGLQPGWTSGYEQAELVLSIPAWRFLGIGSLDPTDVRLTNPLTCTDGSTLLSQREQSHTMRAIPADPDAGLSVLPLGQTELGGAHEDDQSGLFEGLTLRPMPMSQAAIEAQAGPTSTSMLVF